MFKRIHFIVVASLMAAGLAACSAHVDGGTPNLNLSAPSPATPVTLTGTWASGCNPSNGAYVSEVYQFFADNSLSSFVMSYTDSKCTNQTRQQIFQGTYSVGNPSTVAGATEFNMVSSDGTVTLYDIYEIVNTNGGQLYLGNSPGGSVSARSTSLNLNLPLIKVSKN